MLDDDTCQEFILTIFFPHTGGTLRESLKYASVERVTMVDLDEKVMEMSRKYLPSYSNCTGFGTPSCFDDPRADVYAADFFKWFETHIGHDICDNRANKADMLYDVIILDLLDPEALPEGADFAKYLYSEEFFRRISCSLNPQGVLVSNFGEAPEGPFLGGTKSDVQDPYFKKRAAMFYDKVERIRNLSRNFHHTRVYDTAVPSFRANWAFVMGMVPRESDEGLTQAQIHKGRQDFDGSPAVINKKIKNQMLPTASLTYYQGSIQHGFIYPTADWAGVYCYPEENRKYCEDPTRLVSTMDSWERSIWHPITDNVRTEL